MITLSTNRHIAVTPPEAPKVQEAKIVGGLKTVPGQNNLIELEVVFGTTNDSPVRVSDGDVVVVRGDIHQQDFSKKVLELDGKKFVLLPDHFVQLVKVKVSA